MNTDLQLLKMINAAVSAAEVAGMKPRSIARAVLYYAYSLAARAGLNQDEIQDIIGAALLRPAPMS